MDMTAVPSAATPEVAQLQARVAELEVAIAAQAEDLRLARQGMHTFDSLMHLHAASTALAGLMDIDQVLVAILDHAAVAAGARTGAVFQLQADGHALTLLAAWGFATQHVAGLSVLSISEDTVFTDALRSGAPVYVSSPAERDARYPQLSQLRQSSDSAAAGLPLVVDGRVIGCFGLTFAEPQLFMPEDRAFLEAIAQQCAAALHRALLATTLQATTQVTNEAHTLLDALFANAPVGLAFVDRDLRFVRINQALADINGQPVGSHIGRPLRDVLPHMADRLEPLYRAVLASGQPILNLELSGETLADPGRERHWLASYYPVAAPDASPMGVGVVVVEISPIREVERALRVYAGQMQALSVRLVNAQEAERRALAHELHDEIGQLLTGLNMVLEAGSNETHAEIRARLRTAQQVVTDLTGQVRQLSLDLRPSMLDDLGLVPALLWHIRRYSEQTHVAVDFKHHGLTHPFPPHVAIVAYRIIQEGLTNVARYARVTSAIVQIWQSQGQLAITIEDEGCGFDVAATLYAHASVGLVGMRERATLLGGQLTIDSAPGEGTRLRATLPLAGAVTAEEAT